MEIRQLKAFYTVSTLLSFSRAARQLNYAQSSISAQIQSLEDDLDVQLFDRLGRKILLTEAGERLFQYAGKILDLAEETRAEVSQTKEPRGSLTIRIPETFGTLYLPQILQAFRKKFPGVKLLFTTCAHDELANDLRKGITDLAFLFADGIQAADLEMEALGFESIGIFCGPGHPLACKKQLKTRDLNGETLLLSKVDCSYRKMFQKILSENDVSPKTVLEFSSVAVIKQCVAAGAGITILPEAGVAEDVSRSRLFALPWEDDPLEVAVLMIRYKDRWISPTLHAFMETARLMFKKQV